MLTFLLIYSDIYNDVKVKITFFEKRTHPSPVVTIIADPHIWTSPI